MNDASGDNVDEHVKALEPGTKKLPKDNAAPDRAHVNPSRWWFASSAFPMAAGTLGPVASAFSICALVRPWRQHYPQDGSLDVSTAQFIADPVWLIVVNACQLAIALASNMALLLNMATRLRFSIAQPVTIVGWYVSALCLVALAATASGPLVMEPEADYIWSQAFYYAVYAACLYFLIASLMLVTFLGAQTGHYPKDFILTASQRTLMLQTISFLVYLLLGALVFSHVEGWSYLDAVYWAAVTLFTVGFGDLYPVTNLGRGLLFPYALVGIISLGLVVGSVRSLVLDRGKRRLDARMMEKKRRKMVKALASKGRDDILVPIRDASDKAPASADGLRTATDMTELERRQEEFRLMRKIQSASARRRRWYALAVSGSTWVVLWLVGAKVFQECEYRYQQWTYFDGVYFGFVSLTTVGYGDITPVSNAGRSFWVFWALLALPTTTVLISNAGDTIVRFIREATDQIATITILPGERGFKDGLKHVLRMLSFGALFKQDAEEPSWGFLDDAANPNASDDGGDSDDDDNQSELDVETPGTETARAKSDKERRDQESPATSSSNPPDPRNPRRPGLSPPTTSSSPAKTPELCRTTSMPRQGLPKAIPSSEPEYHLTLIQEIGRVTQHLKSRPPRKYTFQEWAWYLRLIGEDEGDAQGHGAVMATKKRHSCHHYVERGETTGGDQGEVGGRLAKRRQEKCAKGKVCSDGSKVGEDEKSWSWVGAGSPLMSSQEEAEWILEKLTARLERELKGRTPK